MKQVKGTMRSAESSLSGYSSCIKSENLISLSSGHVATENVDCHKVKEFYKKSLDALIMDGSIFGTLKLKRLNMMKSISSMRNALKIRDDDVIQNDTTQLLLRTVCTVRSTKDLELSRPRLCHCDSECTLFRDCCLDQIELSSDDNRDGVTVRDIPLDNWDCRQMTVNIISSSTGIKSKMQFVDYSMDIIDILDEKQHISMVSRCPEDNLYSQLCSQVPPHGANYSYMLDIPVLSQHTGVWYQNIYCAACYGDQHTLSPYNVSVDCTANVNKQMLSSEFYVNGSLSWSLADSQRTNCTLTATLETEDDNIGWFRSCVPSIRDCSPNWDNHTVAHKCHSYELLTSLQSDTSKVYKNPHCALCNGVTDNLRCFVLSPRSRINPTASLMLIMGAGWDVSENWLNCKPPNGFWDVLHERCQSLDVSCPQGHIFSGVSCIEANVSDKWRSSCDFDSPCDTNKPTNISLFGIMNSCKKVLLHEYEFEIVDRGVKPIVRVPNGICISIAIIIQYSYLAAFCWMNVMSVDIWRTFSSSLNYSKSSRTFFKYSLYAWGTPTIIVMSTVMVDLLELAPFKLRPHLAASIDGVCWFGSRFGQGIFFTLPGAIILLVNVVLFSITVYKIHQHTRDNYRYIRKKTKEELSATLSRSSTEFNKNLTSSMSSNGYHAERNLPKHLKNGISGSREQARFYLYLKLFIIMGMTWLFGFVATMLDISLLMYPFLILNGLQGALIFIMFDFKRKIGSMLWERTLGRRYALPAFLNSSSSRKDTSSRSENNNSSSSNPSAKWKKVSHLRDSSTSSTGILSTGTFKPITGVRLRISTSVTPEETIAETSELMTTESGKFGENQHDLDNHTTDSTEQPISPVICIKTLSILPQDGRQFSNSAIT
uniref:G-protein coupled receptors family 2 profile 2 domain-containing protein n=1 Tax=Timema bartmani TaxID=61472 RepID=A0A7R9F3C7_9NEOP|nr:unnamed protein product [Timema bartmani]